MKHMRLICTVAALVAVGGWAVTDACEDKKTSQASAASYANAASSSQCASSKAGSRAKGVSATTAAHAGCSAEQMAACKAAMEANAQTASMDHCGAAKTTAVTASAGDHCGAKSTKTSAVTASAGDHCGAKGAKTSAVTASAGDHCAAKSTSAMAAGAGHCNGQGIVKAAQLSHHAGCDACMDMAGCASEIEAVGASSQIVPLKNGVMFVYTADAPSKVRAVQAALARRTERMTAMTTAGDKASLCSECKAMRGAAASGKLNREVVNIEGGCLSMLTSTDPKIVARIHSMTGVQVAARVKL